MVTEKKIKSPDERHIKALYGDDKEPKDTGVGGITPGK